MVLRLGGTVGGRWALGGGLRPPLACSMRLDANCAVSFPYKSPHNCGNETKKCIGWHGIHFLT